MVVYAIFMGAAFDVFAGHVAARGHIVVFDASAFAYKSSPTIPVFLDGPDPGIDQVLYLQLE